MTTREIQNQRPFDLDEWNELNGRLAAERSPMACPVCNSDRVFMHETQECEEYAKCEACGAQNEPSECYPKDDNPAELKQVAA